MSRRSSAVTRQQLIEQFDTIVTDTEQLLKTVVNAGGEKAGAVRTGIEQNLAMAKERLQEFRQSAVQKTQDTAHATDEYVHANPWQVIGIAAATTAIIGMVAGLLLNRRAH